MQISIDVPDEIAGPLEAQWGDLPRHLLEDMAVDAYRQGLLTAAQVGRLLGLRSRFEIDAFLKQAGAFLDYNQEDLERDSRLVEELLAR